MKHIGQTLAVLAAVLVVVGFWLAVGALSGSTGTMTGEMSRHGMEGGFNTESGFNLAGIVQILPTLAIVAIVTAIVAPIKQRLLNKRRTTTPTYRPQPAKQGAA